MAESRDIVLKITADNTAAKKDLKDTERSLNANQKALQDLNREYKKGKLATDDYTKAVDGLTQENSELLLQQKQQDKNIKQNAKSVQELRNRYKQLRETANALNTSTKQGQERFKKLTEEAFATQEQIRDFDRSISGSNTLVGEYTRGILDAAKQQRIFGVSVGDLGKTVTTSTNSISSSSKALKFFKIALASTGVGALVVALGSLVTFLTKSQKGMDAVNKVTAVLGQLLDEVTDVAIKFGESIFDAISNPKEAIKDLGNLIVENIENRFKGIALIGDAIVKLFNNITDESAWKDLGDAVIQTGTGITNATDKAIEFGNAVADVTKNALEDAKEAGALEERRQQLARDRVNFIVREAELTQEIAKARADVENRELSVQERQAANLRSIELTNQLESERIGLKKEELDILVTQNSLAESTLEDVEKEKQLEAEILNITAQKDNQLKSLFSRQKAINSEVEKENQIRAKGAQEAEARLLEQLDREKQAQLDLEQFRLERAILEEENAAIRADREVELEQFKLSRLLEAEGLFEDEKRLLIEKSEQSITNIRKKSEEEQKKGSKKVADFTQLTEDQKKEAVLNTANTVIQSAQSIFGESKSLSSVSSLINTFQAITNTLANVPAPLNIPASVAVGALGVANVAKINGAKFEKGGIANGGLFQGPSHSNGGVKFKVGGTIHEAEGGEAIINKRSTRMFKPLLSSINAAGGGKKFAAGGLTSAPLNQAAQFESQNDVFQDAIAAAPQPVVRVSEINDIQTDVNTVVQVSSL